MIVTGSSALQAREQAVLASIAAALATTVAHAVLGVHRALPAYSRRRLVAAGLTDAR